MTFMAATTFKLWAFGDAHVGTDLKRGNRESLADALRQSEFGGEEGGPPFDWDIDPLGENLEFSEVDGSKRPCPVEGTRERYSFRVGNVFFLVMSDINEPSQTVGRGDLGGNPAGVVSGETFAWWKQNVAENPDSIVISAHHYVLKDTTVASGEWEGRLALS